MASADVHSVGMPMVSADVQLVWMFMVSADVQLVGMITISADVQLVGMVTISADVHLIRVSQSVLTCVRRRAEPHHPVPAHLGPSQRDELLLLQLPAAGRPGVPPDRHRTHYRQPQRHAPHGAPRM